MKTLTISFGCLTVLTGSLLALKGIVGLGVVLALCGIYGMIVMYFFQHRRGGS